MFDEAEERSDRRMKYTQMRDLGMTYNFDPERWHENEYLALETLHQSGDITDSEFEEQCSNLLRRYEEMLSRLDGAYNIPK